jgi:hypothetical protein
MATVELHALRRLSSSLTFFYKRVFPICWFGFVVVFAGVMTSVAQKGNAPVAAILLGPVILAVVGTFIMKFLLWKNVDEVWDAGDSLLVRDRDEEELIPLSDVRSITWSRWSNPESITLSLAVGSRFGDRVTFMLPHRWMPTGRHPVVTELLDRVEQARRPA